LGRQSSALEPCRNLGIVGGEGTRIPESGELIGRRVGAFWFRLRWTLRDWGRHLATSLGVHLATFNVFDDVPSPGELGGGNENAGEFSPNVEPTNGGNQVENTTSLAACEALRQDDAPTHLDAA
jgi:hypothetical protein